MPYSAPTPQDVRDVLGSLEQEVPDSLVSSFVGEGEALIAARTGPAPQDDDPASLYNPLRFGAGRAYAAGKVLEKTRSPQSKDDADVAAKRLQRAMQMMDSYQAARTTSVDSDAVLNPAPAALAGYGDGNLFDVRDFFSPWEVGAWLP